MTRGRFDPHAILDAALADDSERLHQLARDAGMSMRTTLYHAAARLLNALAASEAEADRHRAFARDSSPAERAILLGDSVELARCSHSDRTGATMRLIEHRVMNSDGELTAFGDAVVAILRANAAAVRETALSDEDMDHSS